MPLVSTGGKRAGASAARLHCRISNRTAMREARAITAVRTHSEKPCEVKLLPSPLPPADKEIIQEQVVDKTASLKSHLAPSAWRA